MRLLSWYDGGRKCRAERSVLIRVCGVGVEGMVCEVVSQGGFAVWGGCGVVTVVGVMMMSLWWG